jgi:nucleoside-diphosphate-sugar epimerase
MRVGSDDSRLKDPALVCERHLCDLADFETLDETLHAIRPEIIFHVAAYGAGRGQRDSAHLFSGNVLAARNLIEASRDLGLERLVYTGGSSEYGHHATALSETTALKPVTPYGAAKAAATLLFQAAAREAGRSIVILRPFSIYGPFEPASRLIPTAIRTALRGETLPLTREPFARDFVFVEDVVEACLRASDAAGIDGETFNVGTGIETSNHAVVATIERVLGRRIDVDLGAYEPHRSDTGSWRADPEKARTRLQWQPRTDFEGGIRQTIEFMRGVGDASQEALWPRQ